MPPNLKEKKKKHIPGIFGLLSILCGFGYSPILLCFILSIFPHGVLIPFSKLECIHVKQLLSYFKKKMQCRHYNISYLFLSCKMISLIFYILKNRRKFFIFYFKKKKKIRVTNICYPSWNVSLLPNVQFKL